MICSTKLAGKTMASFALSLALAAALYSSAAVASEPTVVTSIKVTTPRPIVTELVNLQSAEASTFVGIVSARSETDLGFPVIGTIAERPVTTGDRVSKGDVLARLDSADMDAALRAAVARVGVADARLRSAIDAEARARALRKRGVDSATRLEDTQRALVAARSRREQAQATLARARDVLGFATLTAPQDGVITKTFAEAGATVSAGQAVVQLADFNEREVVIDLSEQDVASVDIGMVFETVLAANSAITASATLLRIDPVTEQTTRTRRLHLTLSAASANFRLGSLVRVSPRSTSDAVISLPVSAIVDLDQDAGFVWVVNRIGNTVVKKAVTLGETFGPRIRVTSGINTGDEVVVKGIHSLKDGQIVGRRILP